MQETLSHPSFASSSHPGQKRQPYDVVRKKEPYDIVRSAGVDTVPNKPPLPSKINKPQLHGQSKHGLAECGTTQPPAHQMEAGKYKSRMLAQSTHTQTHTHARARAHAHSCYVSMVSRSFCQHPSPLSPHPSVADF